MNLPDCRTLAFEQGILAEPIPDQNRVVLWVPGKRDATFQYWERIGNVARADDGNRGLAVIEKVTVPFGPIDLDPASPRFLRYAKAGDTLAVGACELKVEEMDGPRVARLKITKGAVKA